MSETRGPEYAGGHKIKRILVALDASEDSRAALRLAASLAAALDAQIQGVFVEDVNLLRVAQLSFVRQVRYPSASLDPIDVAHLQEYWRAQAQAARQALAEIAETLHLAWSFAIDQGAVTSRLLAAAQEADLLALGRYGRALLTLQPVGSTAQAVSLFGRSPVLLAHAAVDLDGPVVLVYGDDPVSQAALELGGILANKGGRLHLLLWSANADEALALRARAVDALQELELNLSFRRVEPGADARLHDLVNGGAELVVLSGSLPGLSPELLRSWLETPFVSLLIVR